jgi:general secretion pathway protein A
VLVHLSNPTLTRAEFYEYVSSGFGFSPEAATSKTIFLRELEAALVAKARDNGILALVVDEAQSLPHELLEEIRLLTNTEAGDGRSMAVVIVGQPELAGRLNDPRLRQLKQRISLRCELTPFDLRETAAYIVARARIAGGNAEMLFTREAVVAIHEHSKGIPRTISVICDNALVTGFAADIKPVGRALVLEVCRDFELGDEQTDQTFPREPESKPLPAPRAERPRPSLERRESVPDREPIFSEVTRPRRFSFF